MTPVPTDDLPANLVPQSDLPDHIVAPSKSGQPDLPKWAGGMGDDYQSPKLTSRPSIAERAVEPAKESLIGPDSAAAGVQGWLNSKLPPDVARVVGGVVGPATTLLVDTPTAVMRGAAGGAAGTAEALGMAPATSDRLERDLNVMGESAGAVLGSDQITSRGVMGPAKKAAIADRAATTDQRRADTVAGHDLVPRPPPLRSQLAAGKVQQRMDAEASVPTKAAAIIEKRLADEMRATGKSPKEIADQIMALRATGKPITLMDVAAPGGPLESLGSAVARKPGAAGGIINKFYETQDMDAGERLAHDVNTSLGEGSSYQAAGALQQIQKAAAKPAYDAAYAHPPINPDAMKPDGSIGALLDRPSMRAGMANARKIAAEEGVDMNTLGIDLDEQGEPIFVRVPTWRTLDYVKRGVDNVVEQYRDKTTGRLMLDTYGRAADQTRFEYRGILRDVNPEYGKALDSYSGPATSIDALRAGEDFLSQRPEEIERRLATMGPGDREFYRIGMADTLRTAMEKKGAGGDEAKALLNTKYMRRQVRPALDSDAEFDKFVRNVKIEADKFSQKGRITGGSQTAARRAADENLKAETAGHAARALGSMAANNPAAAAQHALRAFQNWRATGDEAVNEYLARTLTDLGLVPQVSGDALKVPPLPGRPLP